MAAPSAPELDEPRADRSPVPWRTIWATIASVGVTWLGYQVFIAEGRVLAWILIAVFFTVVLTPAVDFLEHRARIRRGLATGMVFLVGLALLGGMIYSFVKPLVDQASQFSDDLPAYVEDARNGRGPVGDIVRKYDLEEKVRENSQKIQDQLSNLGAPALSFVRSLFNTILAGLTILVLTFLMLLEAPNLSTGFLGVVPRRHRERVRRVGIDAARAVSGYIFGNVVISVIAGVAAWITLLILGVPYAGVLGLFVAFADLIPLVGATLGAVPTILFAFLHSVPAGIAATVFFIVYQQFENHVLQVSIMARTVKVNPLTVLISVLVGVELFGILGALLAIPAAGVIQVVVRDLYDSSTGGLRREPTVGADEVPVSRAPTPEPG